MGYDREEEARIRAMVKRLAHRESVENYRQSAVENLAKNLDRANVRRIATYHKPSGAYPFHTVVTKTTVAVRVNGDWVDPHDGVKVGGVL